MLWQQFKAWYARDKNHRTWTKIIVVAAIFWSVFFAVQPFVREREAERKAERERQESEEAQRQRNEALRRYMESDEPSGWGSGGAGPSGAGPSCSTGKRCGNTCIAASKTCRQ